MKNILMRKISYLRIFFRNLVIIVMWQIMFFGIEPENLLILVPEIMEIK